MVKASSQSTALSDHLPVARRSGAFSFRRCGPVHGEAARSPGVRGLEDFYLVIIVRCCLGHLSPPVNGHAVAVETTASAPRKMRFLAELSGTK